MHGVTFYQCVAIIVCLAIQFNPIYGVPCGLTSLFDTKNLTKAHSWRFLSPHSCFYDESTAEDCFFTVSFCHPLEILQPGDPLPGMTQQYGLNANTTLTVGQYSDLAWEAGETSFSVQYSNGSMVHHGNKEFPLSVNMIFRCSTKAIWSVEASKVGNVPSEANIDVTVDRDAGKYQFIFNYAGACRTLKPAAAVLSTGSVLLIIFFSLLGAYLILGIVVQSSRGARGYELIPNVEFWSKIPGSIRDGFIFTMDKLTCNRTPLPSTDERRAFAKA